MTSPDRKHAVAMLMKIFPFLAAIVFYFLAFMEWDPPRHAAYNKLGLDLGELKEKLKSLRRIISHQLPTTRVVDEKAVDRIDQLTIEVKEAQKKYAAKAKQEIEKDISIEKSVSEVEKVIDAFFQENLYSNKTLNALMNKIEQIWKEEIRDVVNGVMDDN